MKAEKISKILIPTDYSPNAKRALSYAVSLAKSLEAEVLIFHAFHVPVIEGSDINILNRLKQDENERMEDLVDEVKKEFGDLIKVDSIVEFGSAADWIDKIVEDKNIDLVVMGTKGQGSTIDALLGSVASHVINEVNCSVLVIPEEARSFSITEVLFATDYHITSDTNYYGALLNIFQHFDPNIDIVNFKDNVDFNKIPSQEEVKLNSVFKDFKHSFHFIEGTDIEQEIFNFVTENRCDLIVILTRHYTLWERIFHKSIARQLALHSNVPLFIMHEDD